MLKTDREAFEQWAIAYQKSPTLPKSPKQALAIEIHRLMSDGNWRTTTAIATELKESLPKVKDVMLCIKDHWGYTSSKSSREGYRKL